MPPTPAQARSGLGRVGSASFAVLGASFAVLGFAATSYWLSIAVQWAPKFSQSRLATIATHSPPIESGSDFLIAFARYAFLPGLIEELLFRGVLFGFLLNRKGPWFATIVSALLFGIVHLDAHHAAVAGVLGLQLGLIRWVHGLGLTIVAHIANNTLALATAMLVAPAQPFGAIGSGSMSPSEALLLLGALLLSGISCAALVQTPGSRFPFGPTPRSALQSLSQSDD